MAEPILEYVGSRIRLYRKTSGLTMDELARKVHKSKSSISKYESGQIAVDIATLFDIAQALDVSPNQLMDYSPPSQNAASLTGNNVFDQADCLYLFHMYRKNVHLSIIHFGPEDGVGKTATMFYKVDDADNLEQCDCIYHGHMHSHSTVLNFVFRNYHNPAENILLNFCIPMRKTSTLVGMISGLGMNTMMPTARKIILSSDRLTAGDHLREMLTLSSETLREIKNNNMLVIPFDDEN